MDLEKRIDNLEKLLGLTKLDGPDPTSSPGKSTEHLNLYRQLQNEVSKDED